MEHQLNMNLITKPVVLSVLRKLLTLLGGASLASYNDSDLEIAAGAIVTLIPIIWGVANAVKTGRSEVAVEPKQNK